MRVNPETGQVLGQAALAGLVAFESVVLSLF